MGEAHLQQVLQNLISNALKYRDQSPPRIHISATRQSADWCVSVKDNGIGIDPQYKEKIFGVFKRLHHDRTCGGTGIGLAICKRVVERYGGVSGWNPSPARVRRSFSQCRGARRHAPRNWNKSRDRKGVVCGAGRRRLENRSLAVAAHHGAAAI